MLPIRITLAGCSTISVIGRSASLPSAPSGPPSMAMPFGPTTTTCGLPCSSGLVSSFICLTLPRARDHWVRRRILPMWVLAAMIRCASGASRIGS